MALPKRVTVGQLLINEALPEDLRDYSRPLDKKGLKGLLGELAAKYPERYREVSHRLNQVGENSAYESGGNSFGLSALRRARSADAIRGELSQKLRRVLANDALDDDKRNDLIVDLAGQYMKRQQKEIFDESAAEDNPLARQIISGARGNQMNLASLRGSDLLYTDHRDKVIPIPILKSYSEGLSPAEYWAGAYGARKGVLAAKFCLSSTTLVLMADFSTKELHQIHPGDLVMGADQQGRLRSTRVIQVHDNGKRPCWRYRFRVGNCHNRFAEIIATEDHRVLGRYRARNPDNNITDPSPLPLEMAKCHRNATKNEFSAVPAQGIANNKTEKLQIRSFLVGLLLGRCNDPDWEERGKILSCSDDLLADDTWGYMKVLGLTWEKVSNKSNRYILKGETVERENKSRDLLKALEVCVPDAEKRIPQAVWNWSPLSIASLLGGLFSIQGDVSVRPAGATIRFYAVSRELVRGVQKLLELGFGIWSSSMVHTAKEKKTRSQQDLYSFSISHAESLAKFCDLIPLAGKKRRTLEEVKIKVQTPPQLGFKVYSREKAGNLHTLDLEVDTPDHLFCLANGLVVSNSTQEAGFLSKQLNQIAHRLLISDDDDPRTDLPLRGLPVEVDDDDNEGSLLAQAAGPYGRNTVLTPKVLANLRRQGIKRLLVRSPAVGGAPDGGVYSRDVGVRERGGLPARGEMVGLTSSQALSEPLSQGQLSAKHSGGVAGEEKALSGFDHINQTIQIPKVYRGGAAHAQLDGTVQSITPAPAGGSIILVDDKEHFVPAQVAAKVKKGQTVEAGDVLSQGMPNPAEIVRHKGIGEGRRYFMFALRGAFRDAGMQANRRNIELLSRGLINHVRLTDETPDGIPDDVVQYSTLEHTYKPRAGAQKFLPQKARGKYLERPVLHYTIGTPIRPSVIKTLQEFGIKEVEAHDEPPPFQPEMIRGMYGLQHDPDWMTRMFGSGLKKSLLQGVHRGATSDPGGTSFVPGLARGVGFGQQGSVQTPGPQPSLPEPESPPAPSAPAPSASGLGSILPWAKRSQSNQANPNATAGGASGAQNPGGQPAPVQKAPTPTKLPAQLSGGGQQNTLDYHSGLQDMQRRMLSSLRTGTQSAMEFFDPELGKAFGTLTQGAPTAPAQQALTGNQFRQAFQESGMQLAPAGPPAPPAPVSQRAQAPPTTTPAGTVETPPQSPTATVPQAPVAEVAQPQGTVAPDIPPAELAGPPAPEQQAGAAQQEAQQFASASQGTAPPGFWGPERPDASQLGELYSTAPASGAATTAAGQGAKAVAKATPGVRAIPAYAAEIAEYAKKPALVAGSRAAAPAAAPVATKAAPGFFSRLGAATGMGRAATPFMGAMGAPILGEWLGGAMGDPTFADPRAFEQSMANATLPGQVWQSLTHPGTSIATTANILGREGGNVAGHYLNRLTGWQGGMPWD
jgi:hypothetical protein